MDHGRIEQEGSPRELYEHPANEFVMSFIGPVNRLGDAYVRPHDIDICEPGQAGCITASIERVIYLGFDNRVELVLPDGERVWAQLTRDTLQLLEPRAGQTVGVDLSQSRRPGWQPAGDEPTRPALRPAAVIPMRDGHDAETWQTISLRG